MPELLTHSRQASFKECRRKHQLAYEIGLRSTNDSKALRQGSAFHAGVEALGNGKPLADAVEAARSHYLHCPLMFDFYLWEIERETVERLVCAYEWRWATMPLKYLAVELPFHLPLVNPETGKPTPSFDLAGKIDAIVELEDGRLAVKETKLLGDDIGPDSDLWRRMRIDHQISLYIHAARRLGYPCDTVLYDVARKPGIKPEAVPVLDGAGAKIVLDAYGNRVKTKTGVWRQTGSKEDGYILQARPQTPAEWGEKLTADICERPDYYFQRQEVPRLDSDLEEYQQELWEIQRTIREAQKSGHHFRTVSKNCVFCPYFDSVCHRSVDPNGYPPEGFEFVKDRNPELLGESNDSNSTTASGQAACATAATADEFIEPGTCYF